MGRTAGLSAVFGNARLARYSDRPYEYTGGSRSV